ncbi:hypothetical protein EXIGLDRAFT_783222 [Exidia glandulosa HHB12029]|uniref:Uncharacterized protein n=1 Tax=Exidia glandulosa HHB12029 TaxID=1314781 RepID=A0A166N6W4_EXIGL|nr:hypothetical protein EXIGLDRAFT_783222 [Exidia glandulosa HHB12029]
MPPTRPSEAAAQAKATRAAQKEAIKSEVTSLLSMFQDAVQASATKLDMTYEDLQAVTRLTLTEDKKSRPVTLWNACVAYSRDIHPGADWDEVLAEARSVKLRVEATIARPTTADEDAQEECRVVQDLLQQLRTRHDEDKVPVVKTKTQRGISSHVAHAIGRISKELDSLHKAFDVEYAVLLTRGTEASHIRPWVCSSPKADDFFSKRVEKELNDIALSMEGHVVFGAASDIFKGGKPVAARTLVPDALNKQLRELSGDSKAHIPWSKPELLETRYGVRIVGWPSSGENPIPFKPMTMMGHAQARRLHAMVLKGTLRLEKVTSTE